jgi:starvation-inducible DNA-binding protein
MKEARTALADTFFMYLKAHSYHWNVEGIHFPQLHEFFGNLYEELHEAVDPMAEHIRALNEYAPKNIEEMYSDKTVDCLNSATNSIEMVKDLLKTNVQVVNSLNNLFKELEKNGDQGFMNFVADRLDQHKKHGWMLRSIQKDGEHNG